MSDESEAGAEASAASAVDRGVRLATPPSDKLVTITTNMNTNLTALLSILQVRHHHKGCDSYTERGLLLSCTFSFLNVHQLSLKSSW